MIRLERDYNWWFELASHPAVSGAVMGLDAALIAECAAEDTYLPLASENGGFLFCRLDGVGFVRELHTLYTPEGWGREVHNAAREACEWVFRTAQVITTFEAENNPRSQPPRSFGFTVCGPWQQTPIGSLRGWVLTKAAWQASPARRRMCLQYSPH